MKRVALLSSFLAALAAAPAAHGALVTGTITGAVTSTGGSVAGISVGSLVSGSYTYDNATTLAGFVGPVNPFTAFSLTIGTNPRTFGLADLQTGALPTGGNLTPGKVPGNSTAAADALFFFFNTAAISGFAGAQVVNQSLQGLPPQSYNVNSDASHSFSFSFGAVSSAAVPEPASLAMLGLALVGAGVVSRVRRRA